MPLCIGAILLLLARSSGKKRTTVIVADGLFFLGMIGYTYIYKYSLFTFSADNQSMASKNDQSDFSLDKPMTEEEPKIKIRCITRKINLTARQKYKSGSDSKKTKSLKTFLNARLKSELTQAGRQDLILDQKL